MSSEIFFVNPVNHEYVEGRREYPTIEMKGVSLGFILICIIIIAIVIGSLQQRNRPSPTPETPPPASQQPVTLICIPCFGAIFLYGTLMSEIEWRKTRDKWKHLALAGRTTIIDTQTTLYNSYTRRGKTQQVFFEFISPKSGKTIHDSLDVVPINRQFYINHTTLRPMGKVIYLNDDTYALL